MGSVDQNVRGHEQFGWVIKHGRVEREAKQNFGSKIESVRSDEHK